MEGLTKSAALEVADSGVRVNVIAVGTTDTGMLTRFTSTAEKKTALVGTVPLGRMATPEEIAQCDQHHAAGFGEASMPPTGSSIPVDGGKLAH